MGSRGKEQKMMTTPGKLPARVITRYTSKRFCQAIAIRLTHAEICLAVSSQFVCFVKNHQVIGGDLDFLEPREHTITTQRVYTDDQQVTLRINERKIEEAMHLVFPVANQSGRWNNQNARDQPAAQHFTYIETCHDGLPRTR